jgi:hypothetical protein
MHTTPSAVIRKSDANLHPRVNDVIRVVEYLRVESLQSRHGEKKSPAGDCLHHAKRGPTMANRTVKGITAATTVLACLITSSSAGATTYPVCGSCKPTFTASNGKAQHPEIAVTFWQSESNKVWSSGTASPSWSQHIGFFLSLVNNGQYWAKVAQYGTYGGASGLIATPRFSPYATIYTGSVNGDNPVDEGFDQTDIVDIINAQIASGHLPYPQAKDDSVYMVVVPGGRAGSGGCKGVYDCNWSAQYTDGTPYVASYGSDFAGIAHELIEGIVSDYEGVNNTTSANCGGGQIVDPCDCHAGITVNSFEIAPYYSVADGNCVVPDSWGIPFESTGEGWSPVPGGFSMRQGYTGADGVIATNAVENGNLGNSVSYYNPSTSSWVQFGNGGTQFAAGGGIIAGITMDPKNGINYYRIANNTWTDAGGPGGLPPTGVTVTSNGVIVATDPSANPWYFDTANPGWHQIAGPGDQFIAVGSQMLALSPKHNVAYTWPGPGSGFSPGVALSTTQLVSSSDLATVGQTSPGSASFYNFGGAEFIGAGSQLVVTSSPTIYAWLNAGTNDDVDGCGVWDPGCNGGYYTDGFGGWLMGGLKNMYLTGCTEGAAPCVNY